MKRLAAEENGEEYDPGEFEVPPNLDYATIDYKTGLLITPICLFPFSRSLSSRYGSHSILFL